MPISPVRDQFPSHGNNQIAKDQADCAMQQAQCRALCPWQLVSFVFSLQSWLGESPDQKKNASTPAYMSVLMSCSDGIVCYLFPPLPPPAGSWRCRRRNPVAISLNARPDPTRLLSTHTIISTVYHKLQWIICSQIGVFGSGTVICFVAFSGDAVSILNSKFTWQGQAKMLATATSRVEFMSIENLKTFDPFAEADEDTGETKQSQNYIHIRIQQRNGRKTLTTVQGLPKKFDQKKILKVIKKKFACNGTIVTDTEMGEVIQLQGDQRKDVQEFLTDKDGLELDAKSIKVHGF
ncbi:unnamed protein product [Penicillium salamii]|uniref:SUI1 domain-containing protein n=1 Tax=Penicillium salamii TaxID=1612424 RepID=A0A9W4JW13_9EURO|nr:unnamed protein product [Penicillium salamii]CAG8310334.1 unnamed protein product [Penicillium salamii]CAG8328567.1 unnamed protein product [Penicillium salamii]CAG8409231.1 unnamed protein product [Penicillium salamii]CAG8414207.1 unnamed protein product [Penicillium salamii]